MGAAGHLEPVYWGKWEGLAQSLPIQSPLQLPVEAVVKLPVEAIVELPVEAVVELHIPLNMLVH